MTTGLVQFTTLIEEWVKVMMGQWLGANELAEYGNNGRYNPY